jgi:hypothetical protein
VAKRPSGTDKQTWRAQRNETWRRRNRILNILMVAAIIAVLVRYFAT